jgi:hypothetical protein
MNPNTQTILTTLASVPFAMALCALIKRQWPSVTGWVTPVVVMVLTIVVGVLGQYAEVIPPLVWAIIGPVIAAVIALGTVQVVNDAGKKGATTKVIIAPDDPRATLPIDMVPPAPKVAIIRDTTPENESPPFPPSR